ncbi:MAG: 4Fe-4S binding protein [Burkholderiaceae bacterium]
MPTATGLVEYRSEGRLLVIGRAEQINDWLPDAPQGLRIRCLLTETPEQEPPGVAFDISEPQAIQVSGWLGAFEVVHAAGRRETDLVLDLCEPPRLAMPLPPPGYLAPGDDPRAIADALATLAGLTGRFDKPQFFQYKPNLCAHGASELPGCTRCLDACPAEAIISIGDKIEVKPPLCQGGGVCATVCPTGAISYQYPPLGDTLDRCRRMLRAWRDAGGTAPLLLLHGSEQQPALADPGVLPVALEELASAGIEVWLGALCFGARAVALDTDGAPPGTLRDAVQAQVDVANAILEGLGFPAAVHWSHQPGAAMPPIQPATFGSTGGKREALFAAIDHLVATASARPASIALPAAAPMGRVRVDTGGCTLCLSCVSVCPAKALSDGGGEPALRFYEGNCVQCGLCATACPEQVITLEPRLLTDGAERKAARTLHREPPFHCVRCDKPFATRSVIDRMLGKLAGHSMFQDEASRQRLKMCGDCRVLDMMEKDDA